MATIKTPAAGVSPYQDAAALPNVLRAGANGNTVLANPTVAATAAAAATNANSNVIVNGNEALNSLIATSRSGVFEGANVTINLEEQNFNTTNQVTSTTNYPSGNIGEIQFNSGSNSFSSSAYLTYNNGNVVTPGIRTDGYFYGNGAPFIGGGNAAIGNFVFTGDNMTISDANSTLSVTGNGTGNVNISANSKTWTFGNDSNLTFPDNSGASWPINKQRFGMGNIGAWLDGQWTIGEFSGNGVSGTVGIRIDPAIEGNTGITIPSQADSTTQPVQIYNTGGGGISLYTGANNWSFNNNGTTQFPGNLLQPPEGNPLDIKVTIGNAYSTVSLYDTASQLIIQDNTTGPNPAWALFEADLANVNTPQAVVILKPGDTGDEVRWTFDATGNLTLPGLYDAQLILNPTGGPGLWTPGGTAAPSLNYGVSSNVVVADNIVLTTDSGNSAWIFSPNGNLTLPGNTSSINYANGDPYGGSGSASAAGNAGDIQINVAGNIGADSTLRYVDNSGEMTLYADYLNAPGIFTSDIYAGNGSPSNLTITTSYGNATWTFGSDGTLQVPSNNSNPGPGTIASANGYPTLLAFGSVGHGGPELDWMNADDPANTFGNVNTLRNTAYLNGSGLYIGMNENSVVGNTIASWRFTPDGDLTLPSGGQLGYAGMGWTGLKSANGTPIEIDSYYANGNISSQIFLTSDGSLSIVGFVDGGASSSWTFNADGNLTTPGVSGNITGANVITANVFAMSQGGNITEGTIPAYTSLTGNTIVLTPSGGTSADQQLVVYPTANIVDGNHLHLTSGNLYNTELFLGDDFLYVKLANTGNIVINSNDNVGNSAQWNFGSTGNLTFPTGMHIDNEGANTRISQDSGFLKMIANSTALFQAGWAEFEGTGTGNLAIINVNGPAANLAGNLSIQTGNQSTTTYNWVFDNTGNLTFPTGMHIDNNGANTRFSQTEGYMKLSAGGNASFQAGWVSSIGADSGNVALVSANDIGNQGNLIIKTGDFGGPTTVNIWNFAADGNLTFPTGNLVITPDFAAEANAAVISSTDHVLALVSNGVDGGVQSVWVEDIANIGTSNIAAVRVSPVSQTGNVQIQTGNNSSINNWTFDTGGNLTIPGNVNLPLVARLNSGGIGVPNSAEFGTEVTIILPSGSVTGSQIYMSAGTGEGRIIVNNGGNALTYYGVENPGFAGTVAMDPGVTSEYAIQVGTNNQIEIGAVVGPITTTEYVTGMGVLNTTANITGLFANANVTVIGVGNTGWAFGADGNLTLPNGAVLKDTAGNAVVFGQEAGNTGQGIYAVAIGAFAGQTNQGNQAVAIGGAAGETNQGASAVAIGAAAGAAGNSAVAIGVSSGFSNQGNFAVAIGASAGTTSQGNNSIILNATGAALEQTTANTFTVAPVRNDVANIAEIVFYNTTSKEITYGNTISVSGNITGAYFFGNGSQLTDVGAATVPGQNILPAIQTITIAAAGSQSGAGNGYANVIVANVTPVTEYGVIITAGTINQKYVTGSLGNIPGTEQILFNTGLGSTPFTVYAYVTSNAGTYYSNSATGTSGICLLAGTQIALSDGSHKAIEHITYTDKLLSWDFDRGCYAETTAMWIKRSETGSQYNLLTFSDGTTLRTFDQHRIFNKQAGAFTYPMTAATPIGTVTVNEHGQEITLTNKQVIQDTIEYYNVITDYHMNLFSDSVLTSCRFNNIYPIVDMKFAKDSRTLRTRDEFENVEDRFFHGLRLAEQTADIETVEWYVNRLLATEVSAQSELAF